MKAMIFAAGLGTRLRPLTMDRPKALVEIDGKPMLEHLLIRLRNEGFREVVINIHHFAPMIREFLIRRGGLGLDIALSDESDELLDTGGGILRAQRLLEDGEPFLVHNVDILSDLNLKDLYRFHLDHGALATLAVSMRKTTRYLLFDRQGGRMRGWRNLETGQTLPPEVSGQEGDLEMLAFSGIHVLSPGVFQLMEHDGNCRGKFSIIPFYTRICSSKDILSYRMDGKVWFDIGKPETLRNAETWMRSLAELPQAGPDASEATPACQTNP